MLSSYDHLDLHRVPRDPAAMNGRSRNEDDRWSPSGAKINSAENLAAVRSTLTESGPIIVEWRHYRGARAPDRVIFDAFDEFVAWLNAIGAGDSIWVWDDAAVCRDENSAAHGKLPDERGEVPAGGAY